MAHRILAGEVGGSVGSHFLPARPEQTISLSWLATNTGPGLGNASIHVRDLDQDTLVAIGALVPIQPGSDQLLSNSFVLQPVGDDLLVRNFSVEMWVDSEFEGQPPILAAVHDFKVSIDGRLGTNLNRAIQASADDGYIASTGKPDQGGTSGVGFPVDDPVLLMADRIPYFRFDNIDIPQGAEIRSAFVTYNVVNPPTRAIAYRTYITYEDDAVPPWGELRNPDKEGDFSTKINWPTVWAEWIDGSYQTVNQLQDFSSPDLASLVQLVVDRPGWVSGNALAFFLWNRSTFPTRISAMDADPSRRARIEINWV